MSRAADDMGQFRQHLIERINCGELYAGACYLNYPIGPEVINVDLSKIEAWTNSGEQINGRYAPQIFAVLAVEWVQRAVTLQGDVALKRLEHCLDLICSAPVGDAVVTETAIWLFEKLCPDEHDDLTSMRELLLRQIASPFSTSAVTTCVSEDTSEENEEPPSHAELRKRPLQVANEALISVRLRLGPHRVRWFSPYDPDRPAIEAVPPGSLPEEFCSKQLTLAESYFRQVQDQVGLAMAIDQQVLLSKPDLIGQVAGNDIVPRLCEAADLYADANDFLREMLCWERALAASLPNGLTRPLPEPIKYMGMRYATAARNAGFELVAKRTEEQLRGKVVNSRIANGIALAALLLLVAAFCRGDDTLAVLLIVASVLFVHEAGHWLAARVAGIRIKTFRLGVGPQLFAAQAGDTAIEIHAFPAFGYVVPVITTRAWENQRLLRLADSSAGGERQRIPADVFHEKPLPHTDLVSRPRRILFVLGGVAANFVLAFFGFWLAAILDVPSRTHTAPVVGYVWAGGAASKAGIQVNDRIVSVRGEPCRYLGDKASNHLARSCKEKASDKFPVVVLRSGEKVVLEWPSVAKEGWGEHGSGMTAARTWTIDEVHPGCATLLEPGDVIEEASWRGNVVCSANVASPYILDWLFAQARKEPVLLRVQRNGASCDVQVYAAEGAAFAPEQAVDLEPRLLDVVPGSIAWRAGLRQGDLVRAVDDKEVQTHRGLNESLSGTVNRPAKIVVERDGNSLPINLPGEAVFRDYASLGLTCSDWFPRLQGLKVTAIRPEWAGTVPKLKVGAELGEISPLRPFLIRWRDEEGSHCSEDLASLPNVAAIMQPIWFPPFRLKLASITLPPDGPLAVAAKTAGMVKQFFRSLPQNMAASATKVPSSSERQWVRREASRGYAHLIGVWAAVNLAVASFNLLPIPPLDGFRLAELLAGGVFRRKLPQGLLITVNIVGGVMLFGLTALFLYQLIRDTVTALLR
jgi:membrane-associated protease RseP (regulator of RpoE activity)